MKQTFLFLALILSNLIFSQEIVFDDPKNIISKPLNTMTNGDMSYNEYDNSAILSFIKDSKILVNRYNNQFEFTNTSFIQKSTVEYSNFLDSYGTESIQVFIFNNNSQKKFYGISYNLETKEIIQNSLDFKLKGQKFMDAFAYKNKFYILSTVKKSSILKLHILDTELNYSEQSIDLKNSSFYFNGKEVNNLPDELDVKSLFNTITFDRTGVIPPTYGSYTTISTDYETSTIKNNQPIPINVISKDKKSYLFDNYLTLTSDENRDVTTLIKINLNNFSSVVKQYHKPLFSSGENSFTKTNSFLYDNKLFLAKGNKSQIKIHVIDQENDSVMTKMTFDRATPFYADKNLMISNKVLQNHTIPSPKKEKDASVKKRLQKIMKSGNDVGLRVIGNESHYLITIGGYKEQTRATGAGFGMAGGMMMVVTVPHTYIREESLDFYLDKKDFTIQLTDFENPYDKMLTFLDEEYDEKSDKKTKWLTKFKKGNDYILGYYDKKEKKYYLRKFN